jgi:UDP-N-acetylglucosamine 2-epimerase (non-hydrolysing)
MKILIVIGTRPEAIKMVPVFNELKKDFEVKICVTAQHREMLDQVLELFNIKPDYDLNLMSPNQNLFDLTSNILLGMKNVLISDKPDLVLVHGDTSTTMASSLAAFYLNISVGHVEAGLRTNDIYSPFPEEANRQITTLMASYHFAPTIEARKNLLSLNIPDERITVTGNTVIDTLFSVRERAKLVSFPDHFLSKLTFLEKPPYPRIVLITGHRRENFGDGFEQICLALYDLAKANLDVEFIYPVHLNPNVREPANRVLSGLNNVHLVAPLDYLLFVKLMDISYLILTDSGGIQEEAPSLGKPVLVMRDSTERPEAVSAGTVKLVGAERNAILESVNQLLSNSKYYNKMAMSSNPYGDGNASKKIKKFLVEKLYKKT